MQMWFSAQELAEASELGLFRGLPTHKSNILRLIEREGWNNHPALVRNRQGREGGGGREYHIEQLPLDVRLAYVARNFAIKSADGPLPIIVADGLSARAQLDHDAKVAILRMTDGFQRSTDLTVGCADRYFAELFNAGSMDVPEWLKQSVGKLSARTIARWRSRARDGNKPLGYDPAQARKGSGLLETANDGRVRAFILAWIASNPHLSADIIRGYCEDHFGAELVDRHGELKQLPPPRTFQHFIAHLKAQEKVVLTKITDPDRFRSTMKLSGTGAYRHITEPNQLWMIDASPVDALCIDGRHSLYACIDIATRRLVITLSKTPRASAVGLLIRKATLRWGVAKTIKTDNGSDFVAIATKRLFDNLDIQPDVSQAYTPEEKGHVERVIKTFQHEVCPQLPGYVGHSVGDRTAIEGRKGFEKRHRATDEDLFEVSLTATQLQQHIDDWVEFVYHEREHGGLEKRSPNEVTQTSTATIHRVDERALDVLLMPVAGKNGRRVMTKQGIKDNHKFYVAGSIRVGSEVFCRRDPLDMGKMYVFALDGGQFLDVAICPELAGVNPVEFIRAQKEISNDLLLQREREIKADIRELKRDGPGIERTIRLAKHKAAEKAGETANIIQLPKREETHSTAQIAAALDAAEGRTAKTAPLSDRAAQIHTELQAEPIAPVIPVGVTRLRSEETPHQRFRRALDLRQQHEAGVALASEDLLWLGGYEAGPEYRGLKQMFDDFGGVISM